MEEIKRLKKQMRSSLFEKRDALSADARAEWDSAITQSVLAMDEYLQAKSVFCYLSYGAEPDTYKIVKHALQNHKTLLVPKVYGGGKMDAVLVRSLSDMVPGWKGILEPRQVDCVMAPEHIDFAVIPGLACTPGGVRLGQGGGYYDRFLARFTGSYVLLLHSAMLTPDIAQEPHDRMMERIVTEEGVIDLRTR